MKKEIKKQKVNHKYVANVGYAFMIVATVILALLIIPMCWCIPMTIHVKNSLKNSTHMGVGFKVCCIIFAGTVGGILLLCDNEKEKRA